MSTHTERPGMFGPYGGSYIPETLAPSVATLIEA
jgi:tryptophan synthase beta subunit